MQSKPVGARLPDRDVYSQSSYMVSGDNYDNTTRYGWGQLVTNGTRMHSLSWTSVWNDDGHNSRDII